MCVCVSIYKCVWETYRFVEITNNFYSKRKEYTNDTTFTRCEKKDRRHSEYEFICSLHSQERYRQPLLGVFSSSVYSLWSRGLEYYEAFVSVRDIRSRVIANERGGKKGILSFARWVARLVRRRNNLTFYALEEKYAAHCITRWDRFRFGLCRIFTFLCPFSVQYNFAFSGVQFTSIYYLSSQRFNLIIIPIRIIVYEL